MGRKGEAAGRAKACAWCGCSLGKRKGKFCSKACKSDWRAEKNGDEIELPFGDRLEIGFMMLGSDYEDDDSDEQ